eukprot:9455396-Prorocentrum_lima.AAC.1
MRRVQEDAAEHGQVVRWRYTDLDRHRFKELALARGAQHQSEMVLGRRRRTPQHAQENVPARIHQ